eukprot:TRINITY_DN24583_c1_g1_i1.p1 TRINITY_DN24583_c1_g1~~TRINITY_DN24583_c1_g1_i1.p1  ORF type:complete len:594 (-),score=118.60 TRINITY_DN24583_c1_g1_i1:161-1942(-)
MASYHDAVARATKALTGQFCFACEWLPESLPLENRYGTCMRDVVNAMADPAQALGLPPREDIGAPERPAPLSVLVFADAHGFCRAVLDAAPQGLVGRAHVLETSPGSVSQKDVEKLLKETWDLVLFGAGIDPPSTGAVADVLVKQNAVTRLYFYILQELAKRGKDLCRRGVVCLTADLFAEERDINEACGLGLVAAATLFGMGNTARLEMEVPVQYIDTEWSLLDETMPLLASEVFRAESLGRNTVRVLKSGRYVMRQVAVRPYAALAQRVLDAPDRGQVVAITGGNGALALVMGQWLFDLAERTNKTGFSIKFLSRSARIGDELNRATWAKIEARAARLGILVEQSRCDVSQREAVDAFVQENTPHLSGIIHSAGILRDGMLVNQTWEKFEEVMDAKARAALYLHEALERHENPALRFFWLFSSTSVYGNMGQTNYAAANAVLDALARHRLARGRPAAAIQWGAWGEVGMAANLDAASKQRFAQSATPPHLNTEGLAGLEEGLRSGLPCFSCFKYNPPVLIDGLKRVGETATHAYGRNFLTNVAPLPETESLEDLHDYVCSRRGRTDLLPPSAGLVFRRHFREEVESDDEDT